MNVHSFYMLSRSLDDINSLCACVCLQQKTNAYFTCILIKIKYSEGYGLLELTHCISISNYTDLNPEKIDFMGEPQILFVVQINHSQMSGMY